MASVAASSKRRTAAVALASAGMLLIGAFGVSLPASAASITSAQFAVSSNVATATGVTYTWVFVPPTSGVTSLASGNITLSVPAGTAGSLSNGNVTLYGVTSPTLTSVGIASNTITLSFTAGTLTIGRPVSIQVTGITNGAAVANFQSTIGVNTSTDSGSTSNSVSIAANTTTVNVIVPQSLTFSNSTTAVELMAFAGGPAVDATPVALGVSTNNAGGYKLQAALTSGALASGANTIPSLNASTPVVLSTNFGFGANATSTGGTGTGTLSLTAPWASTSATDYLGYQGSLGTPAQVASNDGTTDGDTITLTNGLRIAGSQPSGTYQGTITYAVVPAS